MKNKTEKELFRFTTIGSVDNGKSTLIGRLLFDSKAIYKDQYEEISGENVDWQSTNFNLAHLTDGLKKEREDGITIDVAYRYFSTSKRKFIISDSPGHLEYTRNMVTGSSNANAAVILIDAQNGLDKQTKRHTIISSLLKIPHIIVCVNKMDKVEYNYQKFEDIRKEYEAFASKLRFSDVRFIPISALNGDNIVNKSTNMPWYHGGTLMYTLENMYFSSDRDLVNCRLPVQSVKASENTKYIAGTIAGGVFRKGDKVLILPSNKTTLIKRISIFKDELEEVFASQSVLLELDENINMLRGDIVVRPNNKPLESSKVDAMICWFDDSKKMKLGGEYIFFSLNREVNCRVDKIFYKLDINTLHRDFSFEKIKGNDIARIKLETDQVVYFDPYAKNKITGSFILIDKESNNTVAAGMIR